VSVVPFGLIAVRANGVGALRSCVARSILCAIPLDGMGVHNGALFSIDRHSHMF